MTTDLLLLPNMRHSVLLGADFLRQENLLVHVRDHKVDLVQTQVQVKNSKKIYLQPFSEGMAKVVTPFRNKIVEFLPLSPYDLTPSLQRTDDQGICSIRWQNAANIPYEIPRNQLLGECHLLADTSIRKDVKKKGLDLCPPSQPSSSTTHPTPSALIKLDHLSSPMRQRCEKIVNSYPDVFSLNPNDIGHAKVIPQQIMLKDANKVSCTPPYRLAPNLQPLVHEYVDKLYQSKVIQKSTSPFCSPLMLVKKAGSLPSQPLVEQFRVVHDFRRLNANTIRDSYPLHNLYDLIDKVAKAKVWSVIDLSSGFWNQSLHPASRAFTAFSVPGKGHYEYNRTAQGLCNSPAAFQRLLDFVVQGIPGVYVYIDDVVIATDTEDEHIRALQSVFNRFRKYNLKCRPKKVQLVTNEINYLGYNLTQNKGIRAGAAKIVCIQKQVPPTSVSEVRQFLGLCSFFRRTIPHFATKATPLTQLTRKDSKWKEGDLPAEALKAFYSIKQELIQRPCLQPPNFKEAFILTVDASATGLGAILSQKDRSTGKEHPIAYGSRALNDTERKYASFRREYLALVWGCRHFKPYLLGKQFTVRTDHKPLLSFNREKGSVFDRYLLELSDFDFVMEYIPGDKMPADVLSRQNCENIDQRLLDLPLQINISWSQLKELQKQDKEIKALAIFLKFKSYPESEYLQKFVKQNAKNSTILNDVVTTKAHQAYAPKGLITNLIHLAHDIPTAGHYSAQTTYDKLKSCWFWPNMKSEIEIYCRSCPQCLQHNPKTQLPQPLDALPLAKDFNDRVHIDLLGPLPSNEGHKYVLVMIDAYSKFLRLTSLISKEMDVVSRAFYNDWISTFGPCKLLISDLGSEFNNSMFKTLKDRFGLTHNMSSRGHPMSNGQAEYGVKTVIRYIRRYLQGTNEWLGLLNNTAFAHNTTIHRSIQKTPYEAVFGRRPILPHELYSPIVRKDYTPNMFPALIENLRQIKADIRKENEDYLTTMKSQFDKRAEEKVFIVGDKVTTIHPRRGAQFQKFQQLFSGPYVITHILPHNNVRLIPLHFPSSRFARPIILHKNAIRLIPFLHQFVQFPHSSNPNLLSPLSIPPPQHPTLLSPTNEEPLVPPPQVIPQFRSHSSYPSSALSHTASSPTSSSDYHSPPPSPPARNTRSNRATPMSPSILSRYLPFRSQPPRANPAPPAGQNADSPRSPIADRLRSFFT